ncbi:zf-C3HC4 domain-containing protein [Cephalotus follicularis]|uniref:Zf-C3HC4 domain-containing protein n=1 Tax=Cephalotus follicularis TaxID=3775 RepID=A0A1Q3BWC1_CEPFO|nr:zf-C3HC4 domain-containing protein [Cephalotus follicularis]
MANQVVKVKKETIEACMTCPLCNNLLRNATTITECLHTFCRKCIYDKISEEEIECCPTCNIPMGCIPLEKLRADNSWQDLRAKIFPSKRRKVKAPEVPNVTLPARRKERSLSSLVVSTPKVSKQIATTGRRTKPIARSPPFRSSSFSVEKNIKKVDDSAEDNPSSPETLHKFTQNLRQSSSIEPSQPITAKDTGNGAEDAREGQSDLWKPLHYLVEVANRTKSFKSNLPVSDAKLEPKHAPDNEAPAVKTKLKNKKCNSKAEDETVSTDPVSSDAQILPQKPRRRRKRSAAVGGSGIATQSVLDVADAKHERRIGPIWFTLVASEDQEGDAPLPQISPSFLRIKDGNAPVSCIQKYLMRKLDLASEAKVEIKCMGQSVVPTLQLYSLADLWLKTASTSERVVASVGSSAKDFVMVLAYARKVQEPPKFNPLDLQSSISLSK